MSEKKYYTPTIEDFCLHLQYEVLREGLWRERTVDAYTTAMMFASNCIEGKIRVKCLDEQDVLELGWTLDKYPLPSVPKFFIHRPGEIDYKMSFNTKINKAFIKKFDRADIFPEWDSVFYGTIRNKSELKQLMSWLGIK